MSTQKIGVCLNVANTILTTIVYPRPTEVVFVPPQSYSCFCPPVSTQKMPRIARPIKGGVIMRNSELANMISRTRKTTPQHTNG